MSPLHFFQHEIIKIGQSSQMFGNNLLNFQESMTILMPLRKCLESYRMHFVSHNLYGNLCISAVKS